MGLALGLIETVGLSAAAAALDGAADTANVELIGYEKVIGVGKSVSITINLVGEVASVQAAVEYGVKAAKKVGTVLSYKVIPRPHEEVNKLIDMFSENIKKAPKKENDETKE
ncbi:MAG: BMC domain-containing protein [Anaeromicrobium sp.]|jgi:microcompartment protein CcmL/EutN|uniref:BMC domain-containing protein n=1 Tax=Anaeromicrobium sp. TaxID=1929132 RepID=UPI0025D7204E|nr:BMC domain-containing protein [Anaeromicrobium sp.]MCT4593551.1 BMC domain-containing protein [Anaeromicrobium sp.]